MSSGAKKTDPKHPRDLQLDWDSFNFDGLFRRPRPAAEPIELEGRDKYKILLEISKGLSANLVLDELLVDILDTVLNATRMEKGLILLRDEDGRFIPKVARDRERRTLQEADFEISHGVVNEVARTGRPIYIADIEKRILSERRQGVVDGQRSIFSVPLKGGRRPGAGGAHPEPPQALATVGVIYLEGPLRAAEFPIVDVEFIEALAAQASVAIENARLYERVNRDRLVLADENQDLRREVRRKYAFENIVGTSPRMRQVYDLVARVSHSNVSVLLRGESGTGKEVFAKTIHYNSERAKKPFVSINCAALPEPLLESELFGIEKGVATGVSKRIGKFEQADGGTIFLDEIGDMSTPLQAKLLRTIESREVERVGGKVPIPIDVRIVAATNRELEAAIRDGSFREDLFFRLNVVPVFLPPLRDRTSDIPELVEYFIRKHADPQGKRIDGITRPALEALMEYEWPGNVRELENVVQRALLMCDSNLLDIDDLPQELFERRESLLQQATSETWTVDRLVKEYASKVLARNKGNLTRTARDLGLDFKTLKKKIEEFRCGR